MKTNSYFINLIDSNCIDLELFHSACEYVSSLQKGLNGIGTLQEKSVHAVLKNYYCPNIVHHEISIDGFVADICSEGEIIEIQSKAFYTMKNKLKCFLKDYEVTIVYPIAITKYIRWINPETGEVSGGRKSNKKGSLYDIIPEIYSIREFLSYENLHFKLCFIEIEEYKLLDGWSRDKKKGATKTDRIPTKILGEYNINSPEDFYPLLPDTLSENFTSLDVSKEIGCNKDTARILLNLLQSFSYIKQTGTKNRYHLYSLNL